MKLQEVFGKKSIIPALSTTDKGSIIREMVTHLCSNGSLDTKDAKIVEAALLRREELGSTGIGKGVAVPHAKHPAVKGVVGVIGRSEEGIDFDALDGHPVHLVFLLVSSPEAVEPHLATLRKITMLLKEDDLCMFLQRTADSNELAALMSESDERLAEQGQP